MGRGQTSEIDILYGNLGPRGQSLVATPAKANASNIRLGKRQKYALEWINLYPIPKVRDLIEVKFAIGPGQALKVMKSLEDRGLIYKATKTNYKFTEAGQKKKNELRSQK